MIRQAAMRGRPTSRTLWHSNDNGMESKSVYEIGRSVHTAWGKSGRLMGVTRLIIYATEAHSMHWVNLFKGRPQSNPASDAAKCLDLFTNSPPTTRRPPSKDTKRQKTGETQISYAGFQVCIHSIVLVTPCSPSPMANKASLYADL